MKISNVIFALIFTFALSLLLAPWMLKKLRKLKFGQSILEIGPSWHKSKQGTPTVGGLIFIIPTIITTIILTAGSLLNNDYRLAIGLLFVLLCATIGFIDDYTKIKNKHNQGLTVMEKTIYLMIIIALYLTAMHLMGYISNTIFIPFVNYNLNLSFFYFVIMIPLLFFFINSVNLTDGLDGLVTSVTLPYTVMFIVITVVIENLGGQSHNIGIFAASLTGGLIAFLIYNFYPAKVFMGDTGSLFLGGCVVMLAMSFDKPYIIIVGGILYLIEGLSVVLQVGYFKITKGKRLFKMAPLHHHFEMCGKNEITINIIFTIISAIACLIALSGVLFYYFV